MSPMAPSSQSRMHAGTLTCLWPISMHRKPPAKQHNWWRIMHSGMRTAKRSWRMFPIMAPLPEELRHLDPDAGVLVSTTYWRPQFQAADPEHPGEKALVLSFLPTAAEDQCPCGSGKRFRSCCQPLPYWRILCPNPDLHGYRQV